MNRYNYPRKTFLRPNGLRVTTGESNKLFDVWIVKEIQN